MLSALADLFVRERDFFFFLPLFGCLPYYVVHVLFGPAKMGFVETLPAAGLRNRPSFFFFLLPLAFEILLSSLVVPAFLFDNPARLG